MDIGQASGPTEIWIEWTYYLEERHPVTFELFKQTISYISHYNTSVN